MAFNGSLNVDEGFYGLSARAAWSGLLPYRDFGYTQTPLFPYISGALMRLIGFGFLKQRLADGTWGLLAAGLGTAFLWRRANSRAALVFVLLVVSDLQWMYFADIGKADGFVALTMIGAAVAALSGASFGRRIAVISVLGVLGVGCRLPSAAYFLVLWAGLVWNERSGAALGKALLWPAAASLVLIVPFIAASRRNFYFWTIAFHAASRGAKDWHISVADLFPLSPAGCIGAAAVLALALMGRVRLGRMPAIVLLAMAASVACNVLPKGAYPEYSAPLVPVVLMLVVLIGARAGIPARWAAAVAALLVASSLCIRAPLDPGIYYKTRKAAAYWRQLQGTPFPFSGSASTVALEAMAPVEPDMVMSPFCCTETMPEDKAENLHLATPQRIGLLMADKRCRVVILFSEPVRNFVWSMPTFEMISDRAVTGWKAILEKDYALQYGDSTYVVFARVQPARKPL